MRGSDSLEMILSFPLSPAVYQIYVLISPSTPSCPRIAIPDDIFGMIRRSNLTRYLKACKEINIAFIPYEEQVKTTEIYY